MVDRAAGARLDGGGVRPDGLREVFRRLRHPRFVRTNASEETCTYCGRKSKKPIAMPMNDVLQFIGEGISYRYEDPANQNPWDEGEYVFPTMDSRELLDNWGPIANNDDVYEEIVEAFGGSVWNEKNLFGLSEDDVLRSGWRGFVDVVKYRQRYVFLRVTKKKRENDRDTVTRDQMLDRLAAVILQAGLVKLMKAGTRWFRARHHDPAKHYTSAADLGTAPARAALMSNRMSPAGIPMFYGAEDEVTAIVETTGGKPVTVTVATFKTARDAWVVDLTALPPIPSPFDSERRHLHGSIHFLWSFVRDFIKPIERDGREHIEYVPTQVVTEYLRHVFRTETGRRVRGVIYSSSRNGGGKCCVLFVRNQACGVAKPGWQDEVCASPFSKRKKYWLGLVGTPSRHV
jgi:HEPN superfamily RES-like protein/RES domain-containing protein